jgi:outer membrane protein assembly factor BamE
MNISPLIRGKSPAVALAAALAASLVLVSGCAWVPPILQPYRPDIQQGNVVTKEMVDQLRPGMSREQVRFLLGTPTLTSAFHQDRWDYVYLLKRGKSGEIQQRQLTVWFKDNRMAEFRSDEMPPETMADNLILGRDAFKVKKNESKRSSDPGQTAPGPIYK